MDKKPNALITENSPYLLQHAYNPVHWQGWSKDTLKKAQEDDKLVIVSVGYSACHWCHVMEHESFEDLEVADIMNTYFTSIKVDREERPDVDQLYMSAAQLTTGKGGWPLNVICLPDGRPVYAGTYFRKEQWIGILEHLTKMHSEEKSKLEQVADRIQQGISQLKGVVPSDEKALPQLPDLIYKEIVRGIDLREGGYGRAPKFPMPSIFLSLLGYGVDNKDKAVLDAVNISLNKISRGGIYDHVGGGFSRYSVDDLWLVPHFEKMLYDNGQLISLFSEAYAHSKEPWFRRVVEQTLGFVKKDWMTEEGAFYSAFDADSEGIEGKYYVWSKQEVEDVLQDRAEAFCSLYDITKEGNWEESNIPHLPIRSKDWNYHFEDLSALYAARSKRVEPGLDDKIIAGWNALMLKGCVDAYRYLGQKEYLEMAESNAKFIMGKMVSEKGILSRAYKFGRGYVDGFVDDYAYTIQGFIALYQVTFDKKYIEFADQLMDTAMSLFFNSKFSLFNFSSEGLLEGFNADINITDGVEPSSNSVMARNLLQIGAIYHKYEYLDLAQQMILNVKPLIEKNPAFTAYWLMVWEEASRGYKEISIVGDEISEWHKTLMSKYIPRSLLIGGSEEDLPILEGKVGGSARLFLCQNQSCTAPFENIEEYLELLKS